MSDNKRITEDNIDKIYKNIIKNHKKPIKSYSNQNERDWKNWRIYNKTLSKRGDYTRNNNEIKKLKEKIIKINERASIIEKLQDGDIKGALNSDCIFVKPWQDYHTNNESIIDKIGI